MTRHRPDWMPRRVWVLGAPTRAPHPGVCVRAYRPPNLAQDPRHTESVESVAVGSYRHMVHGEAAAEGSGAAGRQRKWRGGAVPGNPCPRESDLESPQPPSGRPLFFAANVGRTEPLLQPLPCLLDIWSPRLAPAAEAAPFRTWEDSWNCPSTCRLRSCHGLPSRRCL